MSLKKDGKMEAEDLEKVNGGIYKMLNETDKKPLGKTDEQILLQKVQLGQAKLYNGNGDDQQEKLTEARHFTELN